MKGLSAGVNALHKRIGGLFDAIAAMPKGNGEAAEYCRDKLLPAMGSLREAADALETITAKEYWPFPGYEDLLFNL